MHNLEQMIAQWRETMVASQVGPEALEELEIHLRENMEQLIRSGMTEEEGFQRAVRELGQGDKIASEFQKLERVGTWWPVKIVTGIGICVALAMAILLIARLDAGRISFLLATHVFTVTVGYTTTFLIGGLGICYVTQRSFAEELHLGMRSLTRITFILGGIAAALSAIGVILAMIWAKSEWGRYWDWDPLETGAFLVMVWQVCFLLAHRFGSATAHRVLVMSLVGNIVVSLGWFGAHLLREIPRSATPSWGILLLAVGCNLAFFLMGLAPPGWLRPGKVSP